MKTKPNPSMSWCIPGRKCWCETSLPEIFLPAHIKSFDETSSKIEVQYPPTQDLSNLSMIFSTDQIFEYNEQTPPDEILGFDDMVTMDCLNEAELLHNLHKRYKANEIFTYIGPTLLVINPYKSINESFSEKKLKEFHNLNRKEIFNLKENSPHVFAIAGKAFHQLFDKLRNQTIVISGESGAGKTENAKYAMNFLTSLSCDINEEKSNENSNEKSSEKSKENREIYNENPIEERILGCNPILEAFGNAKTVRNDNSSRFGKYVRILVEKSKKKIKGAAISNYLLEKSRVTFQPNGERNYHIFYQIFLIKDEKLLKELKLFERNMADFEYLKKSSGISHSVDDANFFREVLNSFDKMNFKESEKIAVFRILSGILYLGNIEFSSDNFNDNNPCDIVNKGNLMDFCDILGLSPEFLSKALVFKTREISKHLIESPVNKEECVFLRDSLSKSLYEKLFKWLVKRLNFSILPKESLEQNKSVRKSIKIIRKSVISCEISSYLSIGLLDIFGFEDFVINSFEQLCINFTNEKLQQLYIAYVFKSEEEEFTEEGLKDQLYHLSYEDNQPIIDIIDKFPLGIFDLLDESCALGSENDENLLQKIAKIHKENTMMGNLGKEKFVLVHTAKKVEYTIKGFRIKNKDLMTKELEFVINNSKFREISRIYEKINRGF